ncbi:MAG TPA: SAM-dependent methyltransferase [Cyanothece sp. UBA12306]|nr:SAM-dependent methyltransferase [Cyanothece sp. UBA12306]
MVIQLNTVIPLGRTFDEYVRMFDLTQQDLNKSILSVADGPASFNAEGTKLGFKIKSVDPLYKFSSTQIKSRFDQVVDNIIKQVEETPKDWVWTYHKSSHKLRKNREKAINVFCQDYEQGQVESRYEIGELPQLKYLDCEYELGLSSHFLFLYSEQFDQDFHLNSIKEMLRVCQELRIFPLLTLKNKRSPYLEFITEKLEKQGHNCQIKKVSYQLQAGGNEMLKITKNS